MSEIRTGLWEKTGKNGPYHSGKVSIDGNEYWVNIYKNERKTTEKHPDLNLVIKPTDPF